MTAATSVAQANDNPIDWTVFDNFIGPFGNDVPLRIGQHDDGVEPGFGRDHIIDAHGFVPPHEDIQETLAVAAFCPIVPGTDRVVCDNPDLQLIVVFATHVDARSGDGRPFGIITAFYYLPCLSMSSPGDDTAPMTLPCGVLPPPTVNAGSDSTGLEGVPVSLHGSVTVTVGGLPVESVAWSYSAVAADPGTICNFGDATALNTSFTCTDDGSFDVTLTASDGVNPPVSDTVRVVLANSPPQLALGTQSWQVFRAGAPVLLTATTTDAVNDVLTCNVNWDDSTEESYPANGSNCNRAHSFTGAGMYTVRLTVSDDDGGAASATLMVIVYDPQAGYPTAGGWMEPEPELSAPEGKATFQFNPQYQSDSSGPTPETGKVSFRFPAINLILDSTTLEWLVVTTDGKAAVKGTAAVNGVEGYGFVLYAYDEPDKLRLVVWSLTEGTVPGENLLFDNVAGASFDIDDANPQDISRGSLTIHT